MFCRLDSLVLLVELSVKYFSMVGGGWRRRGKLTGWGRSRTRYGPRECMWVLKMMGSISMILFSPCGCGSDGE